MPATNRANRNRINRTVLVGVNILILAPVVLTTLFFAVDRDGGAFLTIASGILDGKIPYRDFFDHKPPGLYYVFALLLGLSGRSIWGIKVFLLLLALSLALLTALSLRKLGGDREAQWLGAVFSLLGWIIYQGYTPVTETLVALCVAVALVSIFSLQERAPVLVGFVLGLAIWAKQPAAILLPVFIGYIIATRGWKAGLLSLGAALFPVLAVGVWLWAERLGQEAWQQIAIVNLTRLPIGSIRDMVKGNFNVLLAAPTMWVAAVLPFAFSRRREVYFLTGLLVLTWASSFVRPTLHSALAILPMGAILAALGFRWLRQGAGPQVRHALVFLLLTPLWIQTLFPTMAAFSHGILFQQIKVGQELEAMTGVGEPILVAAAEPQYYFFAHRYPPGQDVYLLGVNHSLETEEEMIAKIREGTVRVITIAENQYTEAYASSIRQYLETHCRQLSTYPNLQAHIWGECRLE